ncbi:hypothetical protein CEXT_422191 [Caerostris extrusa]|uniref:Uncharacterized protein n=1 Tax=Caerostris extrusa TaxID=172846 RepID=A0AAV4QGJ4_CAEEX|nr:hypothetical protein CEXT_422191 [Caerostris extrusa]
MKLTEPSCQPSRQKNPVLAPLAMKTLLQIESDQLVSNQSAAKHDPLALVCVCTRAGFDVSRTPVWCLFCGRSWRASRNDSQVRSDDVFVCVSEGLSIAGRCLKAFRKIRLLQSSWGEILFQLRTGTRLWVESICERDCLTCSDSRFGFSRSLWICQTPHLESACPHTTRACSLLWLMGLLFGSTISGSLFK